MDVDHGSGPTGMFSDVLGTSGFFYVGQEYDAETGLQHSRARYYDPVSSEFISQDPLGFAGGDTNLYRRDRNQSVSARPRDRYWSEWAWEMGTSYDTFSMSVHSGLAAAGAVPGFGVIPDLIDLVYTAVEMPFGKSTGTDLGLATVGVAATVVPIGGDQAAAAAKIAARAGRVVRQAATAVGTVAMVAARPIARGVAHAAGALPASVKRFVDEAIGVGKNAVAPVNGMNEFVGPTIGRSGFRTAEELSHAIFSRYQRYADDAYASVMKGIDKGRIKLDPSMAAETQIGSLVDRATRSRLRRWATKEFGSEGPDSIVRVNRWLRDSAGSGYRIPDLAAPGHIFDLTIGLKSGLTPQIADFFQFSGGSRVTIVRPSQLQAVDGGYGSYSILR